MGEFIMLKEGKDNKLGYRAKILADSIAGGVRLTTMEVTFPRFILAEFNTHRQFSRNSASSRAIPVKKRLKSTFLSPFVPEAFGKNKSGMQAEEDVSGWKLRAARWTWHMAAWTATFYAWIFSKLGVHKQHANRIIEPFLWHTVIVTASEWENFFNLRAHPDAQPEIQKIARMMKEAMDNSTPEPLMEGDWHLPYIDEQDYEESMGNPSCTIDYEWLAKLSTARCARVSYLTHDTKKRDVAADLRLHDRLASSGHLSPFEHSAMVDPYMEDKFCGNFRAPWRQYRKMIPGEDVFRTPEQELKELMKSLKDLGEKLEAKKC